MEKFHLYIEEKEDLAFEGNKIAETTFSNNNDLSFVPFGDMVEGKWELYKTKAKRFVCYKTGVDNRDCRIINYKICQNYDEVKQYFGLCDNAKEIYKQAEIKCSIDVDTLDI